MTDHITPNYTFCRTLVFCSRRTLVFARDVHWFLSVFRPRFLTRARDIAVAKHTVGKSLLRTTTMCSFLFAFEVDPRGCSAWDVADSHSHTNEFVIPCVLDTSRDMRDIYLNDLYKRFVISSRVAQPRRVPVSHSNWWIHSRTLCNQYHAWCIPRWTDSESRCTVNPSQHAMQVCGMVRGH